MASAPSWLQSACGALVAYAISRTVGLPGLPAEPDAWLEPLGVVSVIAELVFLFCAARRNFRCDAGQLARGELCRVSLLTETAAARFPR
jgi:hypothetical protein